MRSTSHNWSGSTWRAGLSKTVSLPTSPLRTHTGSPSTEPRHMCGPQAYSDRHRHVGCCQRCTRASMEADQCILRRLVVGDGCCRPVREPVLVGYRRLWVSSAGADLDRFSPRTDRGSVRSKSGERILLSAYRSVANPPVGHKNYVGDEGSRQLVVLEVRSRLCMAAKRLVLDHPGSDAPPHAGHRLPRGWRERLSNPGWPSGASAELI